MEGKTGVRDTHEQIRVIERGMRGSKGEREGGENRGGHWVDGWTERGRVGGRMERESARQRCGGRVSRGP